MFPHVSPYSLRKLKEKKLKLAREAIVQKYIVLLPTQRAHAGHLVGKTAIFCQQIHPIILNKISQLVSSVIIEMKETKRALNHYVQHELPIEHYYTHCK